MPRVSWAPPSPFLTFRPLLDKLLPSLPPTVRDVDVPTLLRRRFVLSGYRPLGLPWRCYWLSLFQIHNETVSAWSPLLAAACALLRFAMFTILQGGGILGLHLHPEGRGFSVDVSSLPLVLHVFSTVTFLSCSAAARLLQSHSERTHYLLSFLDYGGVSISQYGCAVALWLYSSDAAWTRSMLGQVFLPAAALLAWLSCTVLCCAKLGFPLHRKLCHVVPLAASWLLGVSPLLHRLTAHSWSTRSAIQLHLLQVVLFPLSAVFFSCPIPERFSPGCYDIVGHSHQLFHILSSICALVQQEALFQDFVWRRPGLVREFGEERLLLACASFPCLILICLTTALIVTRKAPARLMKEQR